MDDRKQFGHWEMDPLVGERDKKDPVLITLVKRKARFEIMFKNEQQSKDFVDQAMKQLYERIGERASCLFKTITSDNGSEFAGIHEMLKDKTDCFFAYPYAAHERETKENQHKLILRFIPNSKQLAEIYKKTIKRIQEWMNNIPRRVLDYQTAREAFLKELQLLLTRD